MKFREAVKHLEDLGMPAIMPDGKTYRTRKRRRLRNPFRPVPVRVLENGDLPEEFREMVRESRAETRSKRPARRTC